MDPARAFKAPFADPRWPVKAAWAGLWVTLPFTLFAVSGYLLQYVRDVSEGRETLPEWSGQFGRFWVRGLLFQLAMAVYFLPAFVLGAIGFLPLFALAATGDASSNAAEALALLGTGSVFLGILGAILYSVAVSVLASAAQVHFALGDGFGRLFAFGTIWNLVRGNAAAYLSAWLTAILVNLLVSTATSIVTSVLTGIVIGTPLVAFAAGFIALLGGAVSAHLFGQYAAVAYGRRDMSAA